MQIDYLFAPFLHFAALWPNSTTSQAQVVQWKYSDLGARFLPLTLLAGRV